jgi:hypothetical protein
MCGDSDPQPASPDTPEANPARPTVSTPATLPPLGYLQFETGSLGAVASPEFGTRIGINQVTKPAFTPRLELFFMTEPYVHSSNSSSGDKEIHPGEVWQAKSCDRGGFDHGFTHASTQWEEFIGFAYLLPHRLWSK